MQCYLKDGHESIEVVFNAEEVNQYKAFFNILISEAVPPLYCAKLWPKFSLFQQLKNSEIVLKETQVTQIQDIKVNVHYLAQLHVIEQKKIRQFMKYVLQLEIYKNENKCITIRQIFMEKI
ncbi:hypothetical protein [Staphylococcus edaphicus]|uniref:Protein VraC n=1 Tax=Staphylococcus edaphicus TaxID=1955013 RepID=A0A2C6VJX4_9STAP|nr:hypothetical protein [Staphylococcus edaphicus]PHK50511.1 hypothetical protein BTJ66_03410 [Staphylococcus edaphicus]UQW81197.1 hypothetical protein MNY58_11530 [Staphylococcus edaphicus]